MLLYSILQLLNMPNDNYIFCQKVNAISKQKINKFSPVKKAYSSVPIL